MVPANRHQMISTPRVAIKPELPNFLLFPAHSRSSRLPTDEPLTPLEKSYVSPTTSQCNRGSRLILWTLLGPIPPSPYVPAVQYRQPSLHSQITYAAHLPSMQSSVVNPAYDHQAAYSYQPIYSSSSSSSRLFPLFFWFSRHRH